MAKKKEEIIYVLAKAPSEPPPEDGLPPWMATFADMVTLLLCFFVLLLSFSNQDIANFESLKGSMAEAFGVQFQDKTGKKMPFSEQEYKASSMKAAAKKNLEALEVDIRAFVTAGKLQKLMAVNSDQQGVLVRVPSRAIFKPGTAEINPRSTKLLDKVANIMKKRNFNLVVRGHTDDRVTRNNVYSSNWELSAARAASCLRYILKKSGVSSNRMKAVGYAGTKPLVPNTSNRNRAINRRVEFYYQPPSDTW
ncbi:OmpA/MotB family protein [Maridesulfovibrio hydrothermalis]|uniref:OmpA/MotB domain protein n=1 Tax=Maridesulfovibrio hydrothermalis AM13 = DSM 14728 TaxID=1121451 RepID=L0R7J4_9BACT|nr:OmpA family protein [Maridesulfovibrio hydrothermalis]CCO22698.1 OmpA/MotB domain protein [Maridesulfovibrio hydrothermalis AM13 = DSM 14728]